MILRTDANEVLIVDIASKRWRRHNETEWWVYETGFVKMNQPARFTRCGMAYATLGRVIEFDHTHGGLS